MSGSRQRDGRLDVMGEAGVTVEVGAGARSVPSQQRPRVAGRVRPFTSPTPHGRSDATAKSVTCCGVLGRAKSATTPLLFHGDDLDGADVGIAREQFGPDLAQRLGDLPAEVGLERVVGFEGVEDAVSGVADLERVPRDRALLGDGDCAAGFEERTRSSPLPGLASSSARMPSRTVMSFLHQLRWLISGRRLSPR